MKKTMLTALGASALLLTGLAAPAAAQDQNSNRSARAGSGENAGDPNQRVCVQYYFTGSRLPKRECRTRREWQRSGGIPTSD